MKYQEKRENKDGHIAIYHLAYCRYELDKSSPGTPTTKMPTLKPLSGAKRNAINGRPNQVCVRTPLAPPLVLGTYALEQDTLEFSSPVYTILSPLSSHPIHRHIS